MSFRLIAVMMAALVSASAFADDATAQKLLDEAKASYAQRTSSSPQSMDQVVAKLKTAEAQAQSDELKYDILILQSRAYYFKGTHVSDKEQKKDLHAKGRKAADAAEEVSSDYAESAYFAAINLGRWGKANGVVASIKELGTLKRYVAEAMDRETREGKPGETLDGYGPHRTIGRVYSQVPKLMGGGSHEDAVRELQIAARNAPNLALNVVYLADELLKNGSSAEKAEGRRLLTDLLAKDPQTLHPERAVETQDEFAMARDVLAGKELD